MDRFLLLPPHSPWEWGIDCYKILSQGFPGVKSKTRIQDHVLIAYLAASASSDMYIVQFGSVSAFSERSTLAKSYSKWRLPRAQFKRPGFFAHLLANG